MMITLGNFLFRYRNGLFPFAYCLLLFDQSTMWNNDLAAALAGFVVALSGQFLRAATIGLAYIVRGGRHRKVYADTLVTEGIFAHCRNPLYLGNLLIIAGVAIAANSVLFLAIGLPLFFFAYLCIIAAEENYLKGKFGSEFVAYCERVNRIIPDLTGIGKTLQGMEFNWQRLVVKDYGTMFYWSAGIICIAGKNVWLHTGYDTGRHIILGLAALLVPLFIAFATARYLKKSGILRPS
ncbi:MAG TPA: isoprenylcysteine carboxylmethyltransferase family protein [Geobacteraceae bacterium]